MEKKKSRIIKCIYVMFFLFFMGKVFFYAAEIGGFPDEKEHLRYLVYLDTSNKIIPDFNEMPKYEVTEINDNLQKFEEMEGSHNYLGHPPLYYHILRLCRPVSINEDGDIILNIQRLRYFNILLVTFTMELLFCTIYKYLSKRTERLFPHIITLCGLTCVPMLAYVSAGINNDNLAFLGTVLFMIGILRYYEKDVSPGTYCYVAAGFCIAALSKMTVAELLGISLLVIAIVELKKKNYRLFLNKYFARTLILYLIPVIYIIIVYSRYGTIQPSLKSIDMEYFKTSSFFVPVEERQVVLFAEYWKHFWNMLGNTWVTLYGHKISLWRNPLSKEGIAYVVLVILFIVYVLRRTKGKYEKNTYFSATLAAFLVMLASLFLNSYMSHYKNGYMGGMQGRYFLPCVPAFALAGGLLFWELEEKNKDYMIRRRILLALEIVYVILLIYGDFIYFLLNAKLK